MKLTKLFVGAFALSAMLVACDSDSASAKDTEIEELSSSSAVEIASSSSTIRNDSLSSSAIESSSSSAIEIVSSSSTTRNDSSSSSAMETSSSSAIEIASSSSMTRKDGLSSSAIESSSSSAVEIASSSSTIRNDNSSSSSVLANSSSSETTQSSSSSENISAGSVYDATAKTLTDLRNGQTYKTVTIGDQTWMAENLNYAYTGVPYEYIKESEVYASDSMSWCYDNDPANCAKYGRLYTWAAAMDSVGTWSTNGKGCGDGSTCSPTGTIRGICPEGWHLPSKTEWNTLFTAVGGRSTAGKVLKSQTGWDDSGNGTDAFGFSALPAGYRNSTGDYANEGYIANFWSSTEDYINSANSVYLYYSDVGAYLSYTYYKNYGRSVRCVKD